ncbi:hypothetical protein Cni_G25107 [Canna indica]|uniref:Endonuclease/exonuclease/phosphatase domain-containing protein n=1 Tax=Canna indica TaxID=4628 RepID=A0AAQ3QQ75_9LILI|nr:hypothetical protein Cni_G25107 [Canna indica]
MFEVFLVPLRNLCASALCQDEDSFSGQFILAASLTFKNYGIRFWIASVYGPHHATRAAFFGELSSFINSRGEPLILGGDFNATLRIHERHNCTGHLRDSQKLFRIIDSSGLINLPTGSLQLTWSNGQSPSRLAKLDRVLLSLSVSQVLPLAAVQGGDSKLSDHHFLHFKSHSLAPTKSRIFRLELYWFRRSAFKEVISIGWQDSQPRLSGLDSLMSRWRSLRKVIRQWAALTHRESRKARFELEDQVALFSKRDVSGGLNSQELIAIQRCKT